MKVHELCESIESSSKSNACLYIYTIEPGALVGVLMLLSVDFLLYDIYRSIKGDLRSVLMLGPMSDACTAPSRPGKGSERDVRVLAFAVVC